MITTGSIPREVAAEKFPFLAEHVDDDALVISDNADTYGTLLDLEDRR